MGCQISPRAHLELNYTRTAETFIKLRDPEEGTVYVNDLDMFVTVQLLEKHHEQNGVFS